MLLAVAVASAAGLTAQKSFLPPAPLVISDASLHGDMASMMADDGDEDDSQGNFMQQDGATSAYLQDSKASLTAALGPRWNGNELERDAKEKTQALLQGIAGKNSLGAIKSMMGALGAAR